MGSVTNYLNLKIIDLLSTRWFSDFNYNLARIDLLGKHIRLQQGAGQSTALRSELTDGTLAEYIRAVPNGTGVDIFLGRPGTADRVVYQSSSGGAGSRVVTTFNKTEDFVGVVASAYQTLTGASVVTTEGTWDLEINADIYGTIVTPAADSAISVSLCLFSSLAPGVPIASTKVNVLSHSSAQETNCAHLVVKNLPGGVTYSAKLKYEETLAGAYGSINIGTNREFGTNSIMATRVA